MENCVAHNIILAKCGLEFWIEFVKFSFAAAFHIVFLLNLVNLKKHRLRLWILELPVLRIPRTSPILFRCVQSPKKFGWKFWILILQKTEKISAEIWQKLLWKIFFSKQNRKNKRLKNLQLKIFKLKKFVVYHWEKPNKII